MNLETLTKTDISDVINLNSLRRAQDYLYNMQNLQRDGNTLTASVGKKRFYKVEIEVDQLGIHALCSCPYDWGGYCKHIGAVLLRWIQSPQDFMQKDVQPTAPADNIYPIDVIPVSLPPVSPPPQLPWWQTTPLKEKRQKEAEILPNLLEEAFKVQDLRKIAQKRGWKLKGTKKADLVEQIAVQMLNPVETIKAVQQLDQEHAQVFFTAGLTTTIPGIEGKDFERIAKLWGKLKKHKKISTYCQHLQEIGLTIPPDYMEGGSQYTDYVLTPIIRHSPPMLDTLIPGTENIADDIPGATLRTADPSGFIRKIHQLIVLIEQTPQPLRPPMPRPKIEKYYPALEHWDYDPHELAAIDKSTLDGYTEATLIVPTPNRILPDEAIAQLAPVAGGEAELDFMLALLTATGIFQTGSPLTVWQKTKIPFLQQTESMQWATLARTWFMMYNWSALWDILRQDPNLCMRRSLMYRHFDSMYIHEQLYLIRDLALRIMSALPDNRWIKLKALQPIVSAVWKRFDSAQWDEYAYYQTRYSLAWFLTRKNSTKPLDPNNTDDWLLGQWNFVMQLITGPLHWLGLVDLYEKDGQIIEIRLHNLSDLYWDRVEVPNISHSTQSKAAEISTEAVTIKDETITVNPNETNSQIHALLDQIAKLEAVRPAAFVYQLSIHAAFTTFEAGITPAELETNWETLLPQPMPAQIRAQLQNWWDGYGKVRIYENVTVIEFADDFALAEMKAVTSLPKHLIAEISPRLVLISEDAIHPLTAELEKAGYTPKQTEKV